MSESASAARIQEALDREELRRLPELYCHYIWQKDMAVVDLFTDDGAFVGNARTPERAVRGRKALEAEYARILSEVAPKPFIHNHVVELLDADHARGWCYLDLRLVVDGQPQQRLAYYNDTYEKVGGRWRFKERVCNWVRME